MNLLVTIAKWLVRYILLLFIMLSCSKPVISLEEQFLNPPTSAKPYVWWHWMGSNFSKEGITKDLEAMKAEGIGGGEFHAITQPREFHHQGVDLMESVGAFSQHAQGDVEFGGGFEGEGAHGRKSRTIRAIMRPVFPNSLR